MDESIQFAPRLPIWRDQLRSMRAIIIVEPKLARQKRIVERNVCMLPLVFEFKLLQILARMSPSQKAEVLALLFKCKQPSASINATDNSNWLAHGIRPIKKAPCNLANYPHANNETEH